MLKVLIVMTTKLDTSGITEIVLRYLKNIDYQQIKFDFVVPNELNEDIKHQLYIKDSKYFVLNNRKSNPLKYVCTLIKILKKNDYHIVHAHGNSSTLILEMLAAKKANIKVRIAHSHNTTCNYKLFHKILKPFFNFYVTDCFACGTSAGEWLFGSRPFYVIPNANDLSKYQYNKNNRNSIRSSYHLQDKFIIGHVGRFNNQKNQEFLLDIFNKYLRHHNNAFLVLIGSGMNKVKIQNKVQNLNINDKVLFTGEINNVHEWLSVFDLFLMPSKYEGFPLTLIESQNNGLPAIVSDKITQSIQLTNSIYFASLNNIDDWVKKIDEIDYHNREISSLKNVDILKNNGFDIKEASDNLVNLYMKIYAEKDRVV